MTTLQVFLVLPLTHRYLILVVYLLRQLTSNLHLVAWCLFNTSPQETCVPGSIVRQIGLKQTGSTKLCLQGTNSKSEASFYPEVKLSVCSN